MKYLKKISFLCLLSCLCLLMAGTAKAEENIWTELLERYRETAQIKQLIFVRQTERSKAQIELYRKQGTAPQEKWELAYLCKAIIGKNGLGKRKEGDCKTPIGDYGIVMVMGFRPDPGTKATYQQMDEHSFFSEKPRYWYRLLDDRKFRNLPEDADYMNSDGEELFEYCLFLDYNQENTPGRGGYIFMHTGRELYEKTHGCIALREADMKEIVKMVDDNVRVCIFPN